ncbi:MAG: hypothetical protein M0Z55_00800, partial [Peptococcaceae bacterium]|nr:hypothetical protein [Peptococcaceae bacterium]
MQTFTVKRVSGAYARKLKLNRKIAICAHNAMDINYIQVYRNTDNVFVRDRIYAYFLRRCQPLLIKEVKQVSVYGYDFDDLMQESRLVMFELIDHVYKIATKNPFWFFLSMCVQRRLYSLISQSHNNRNRLFNTSYRF